jgi:hypothetical protein
MSDDRTPIPETVRRMPVQPRQWALTGPRTRQPGTIAVMMPYPVRIAEDAACFGDETWCEDRDRTGARVIAHQKALCLSCPLRTACAEWGIAHEDFYVYGGLTPDERRDVRKRRNQALVDPLRARDFGLDIDGQASVWVTGAGYLEDESDATYSA